MLPTTYSMHYCIVLLNMYNLRYIYIIITKVFTKKNNVFECIYNGLYKYKF